MGAPEPRLRSMWVVMTMMEPSSSMLAGMTKPGLPASSITAPRNSMTMAAPTGDACAPGSCARCERRRLRISSPHKDPKAATTTHMVPAVTAMMTSSVLTSHAIPQSAPRDKSAMSSFFTLGLREVIDDAIDRIGNEGQNCPPQEAVAAMR